MRELSIVIVFNVLSTGLFWKRMLKQSSLSRVDENHAAWFKGTKDHSTLIVSGKAYEALNLKPLVYHFKNPKGSKDNVNQIYL